MTSITRGRAGVAVVAVVVASVVLARQYRAVRERALDQLDVSAERVSDVALQLAGSARAGCAVVGGRWIGAAEPPAGLRICSLPEGMGVWEAHRQSLLAEWWLIAVVAILLVGLCMIGRVAFDTRRYVRLAGAASIGAVVVVVADLAENLVLLGGLRALATAVEPADAWFVVAGALSVTKFAVGVPVGVVAAGALLVTLRRTLRPPRSLGLKPAPRAPRPGDLWSDPQPDLILPPPLVSPEGDRWPEPPEEVVPPGAGDRAAGGDGSGGGVAAGGDGSGDSGASTPDGGAAFGATPATRRARWRNARRLPPGREAAGIGICASGGGIRSACVTLGALQELRAAGVLSQARYLVSVSGGGYAVGAFQLALAHRGPPRSAERPDGKDRQRDGEDCDPGGSRSDDDSDGSRSTDDPDRSPRDDDSAGSRPNGQTIDPACDVGDVFAPGSVEEDHVHRHGNYIADTGREWIVALSVLLRNLVASILLLVVGVTLLGLAFNAFYRAVPVVGVADPAGGHQVVRPFVWWTIAVLLTLAATGWVLWFALLGPRRLARRLPAIAGGFAVVAGLVAALGVVVPLVAVVLAWAGDEVVVDIDPARAIAGGAAGTSVLTYVGALVTILWRRRQRVETAGSLFRRARKGVQPLEREVATGLGQLLIVWAVLVILAVVLFALLGIVALTAHEWHWAWWVLPAVIGLVALGVDQTRLSLHPFYRRRLASAFAVRRVEFDDGTVAAQPYDFDGERTSLSDYGQPHRGFPQMIFAAAAALSESERTPPGRRAVSFTFSHDYIGGPDVGWVRTKGLEGVVADNLCADLTVQGAMATSGAAFASSMGRHARSYQTLLALSNARLGTWMPNPVFLDRLARADGNWKVPALPKVRGLPYLIREVLGHFRGDEQFLLCTDGGHYENLGLVELLRQGCRLVYCIDASGDAPPFATTLAEAISLAWEELGVRITLFEPRDLVPGSATPLKPENPLSALNARLSKRAVVLGRIDYPEPLRCGSGPEWMTGRLVVAKAALTPDMPYELLSYAVEHTTFPRQGTGDQFFDIGQSNAYQALGRYLGERAADAVREADAAEGCRPAR